MQRNPGCPTIEEDLERALVRAAAIPEELAGSFVGVREPAGPARRPAAVSTAYRPERRPSTQQLNPQTAALNRPAADQVV
jgi:hypothetical protein